MIETVNHVISIPQQMTNPANEIERAQTAFARAARQRIEGLDNFYSIEIAPLPFSAKARARKERHLMSARDKVPA